MRIFLLSISISLIALQAQAEIFNCDGVWTNTPCVGTEPKAKIITTESTVDSQAAKLKSEKDRVFHDLSTLKFNLQREYGGVFSIAAAERICRDPEATLSDCEAAVSTAETNLLNKQLSLAKIKEEKSKLEPTNIESNSTAVVVQENIDDDDLDFGLLPVPDRSRSPTIVNGVEVPAGETTIGIKPERDYGNTLLEQQTRPKK